MQNNVEKEYSQALFTLACEENNAEKYFEEKPITRSDNGKTYLGYRTTKIEIPTSRKHDFL